jgi:hypothetical protein
VTQEQKYEFINAAWFSDYEGVTKLVLIRIAYFLRLKEDFADIGQDRLARYASCKPRQVRRAVHQLKMDGVLNVHLVKDKKFHNRYTFNLRALKEHEIPLEVSQDLIKSAENDLVGPVVEVSQDLCGRSSEVSNGGLAGPKRVYHGGEESGEDGDTPLSLRSTPAEPRTATPDNWSFEEL